MNNPPIKYLLGLGLLLVLLCPEGVLGQGKTPTETVKSFYKFHLGRPIIFSAHEVRLRKRWFSAELNRLWLNELRRENEFTRKNPNEKPFLGDGFPLQPLEECVISEKIIRNLYEIRQVSAEAAKALVEIKFFQPKECEAQSGNPSRPIETYQLELVKKKNVWLISDWIFSDKKRLTEILNRKEYF